MRPVTDRFRIVRTNLAQKNSPDARFFSLSLGKKVLGISLINLTLIAVTVCPLSLVAQNGVTDFNLDEELRRLEESEKQILSNLDSLKSREHEQVDSANSNTTTKKLSHDAVLPENFNTGIMPDTSVDANRPNVLVGYSDAEYANRDFPSKGSGLAADNTSEITRASNSSMERKDVDSSGFKEIGFGDQPKTGISNPSGVDLDSSNSGTKDSSKVAAGAQLDNRNKADVEPPLQGQNVQEKRLVETKGNESKKVKTKTDRASANQQKNSDAATGLSQSDGVNTGGKSTDAAKQVKIDSQVEIARLQAALDGKEQEIRKLKISESNLRSKLKLYEEEIRRLSDALDEMNRTLVLEKCPQASLNQTAFKQGSASGFDPTTYSPDGPVPLISVPSGTVVYSGPSKSSIPILTLSEDTSVPKIDSENNWVRIIAPNGVKGWIFRPGSNTQSAAAVEKKALDNWFMVARE